MDKNLFISTTITSCVGDKVKEIRNEMKRKHDEMEEKPRVILKFVRKNNSEFTVSNPDESAAASAEEPVEQAVDYSTTEQSSPSQAKQVKEDCVIIGDDRVVNPIFNDYRNKVYSSLNIIQVISGKNVKEVKHRVVDITNNTGPNINVKTIYMFFSAAFNYNEKIIQKEKWAGLLLDIHILYPKAVIFVGGIIQPVYGGKLKLYIKKSNMFLMEVELPYVKFVNTRLITKSSGKRGTIYRNFYADPMYLNYCGLYKVLTKMMRSSFCPRCETLVL